MITAKELCRREKNFSATLEMILPELEVVQTILRTFDDCTLRGLKIEEIMTYLVLLGAGHVVLTKHECFKIDETFTRQGSVSMVSETPNVTNLSDESIVSRHFKLAVGDVSLEVKTLRTFSHFLRHGNKRIS